MTKEKNKCYVGPMPCLSIIMLLISPFISLEALTWIDPIKISPNNQSDTFDPDIAVDPNGNAVIVWSGQIGTNDHSISGATLPFNTTTPVQTPFPASAENFFVYEPTVRVDSSGNAVALWQQEGPYEVQASTLPFNSGIWSPISNLGINFSGDGIPALTLQSSTGNAVAVWTSNARIEGATFSSDGSVWTSTSQVAGVTSRSPAVGVDSSGNAVTVWRQDGTIKASTLPFGSSSWSATTTISSGPLLGLAPFPEVAVTPDGNAVAVWSSPAAVYANFLISGSWQSQTQIDTTTSNGYPVVAADSTGNAVVLWVGTEAATDVIKALYYDSGSMLWGATTTLSAIGGDAATPAIAMSPAGNAIAVWRRYDGVKEIIQEASLQLGSSWTSPVSISTSAFDSYSPKIALDQFENAYVVWSAYAPLGIIQASTAISSFPPTPDTTPTEDANVIQQAEEIISQNISLINETVDTNLEQVQDIGILAPTTGTYPDFVDVYILDGVTPFTTDLSIPSLWCQ